MIEIIALVFLSRMNGFLAQTKGLKFWPWVWYTVLSWIGFEFIGTFIGLLLFGASNLVPIYILAIATASLGYFVIRDILRKKINPVNHDNIDKVGVSDLYPDKKS